MQGQFYLRRASGEDLPEIMRLMKGAGDWVPEPDWFAGDEEETVARHLAREGFILVALPAGENGRTGSVAGFLMVRFPGNAEDNLGRDVGLSGEELLRTAHLETAVVAPEYQGNGLQYRLFQKAEELLAAEGTSGVKGPGGWRIRWLFATVHPDNRYSRRNMEKLGCQVATEVRKYGGKRRLIMWKQL